MSANEVAEGVLRRVVMSCAAWALAERASMDRLATEHLRVRPEVLGVGAAAHPAVELAAWRELVSYGVADRVGALSDAWTGAILQHLAAPIVVVIDAATRDVHAVSYVSIANSRALAVRHVCEESDAGPRTGVEVTFFGAADWLLGTLRLLPPYAPLRARPAGRRSEERADAGHMLRLIDTGAALAGLRGAGCIELSAAHLVPGRQAAVNVDVVARAGTPTRLVAGGWARSALWSGRWSLHDGAVVVRRRDPSGLVEDDVEPGAIADELMDAMRSARAWLASQERRRSVAVA